MLTNFSPLEMTRWYQTVPPEAKSQIISYQDLLTSTPQDKPFVSFNQGVTGSRPARPIITK